MLEARGNEAETHPA
jgi:hypothetical protein